MERTLKSLAKEAKARMKKGFWRQCEEELDAHLKDAREQGISESRMERYFKARSRGISRVKRPTSFISKSKSCSSKRGKFPTPSAAHRQGVLCDALLRRKTALYLGAFGKVLESVGALQAGGAVRTKKAGKTAGLSPGGSGSACRPRAGEGASVCGRRRVSCVQSLVEMRRI